jgi:hypothetical protein
MRGSVAVVDLEVGADQVLGWLQKALTHRLQVFPVILLPAEAGSLEWPLRELGAAAVFPAPVRGAELLHVCRSFGKVATAAGSGR